MYVAELGRPLIRPDFRITLTLCPRQNATSIPAQHRRNSSVLIHTTLGESCLPLGFPGQPLRSAGCSVVQRRFDPRNNHVSLRTRQKRRVRHEWRRWVYMAYSSVPKAPERQPINFQPGSHRMYRKQGGISTCAWRMGGN